MLQQVTADSKFNSNQEVFEFAVRNLAKQGKRCTSAGGCLYRYQNLKCAGGFFIPDELYEDSMENKGWVRIVNQDKYLEFYTYICDSGLMKYTNIISLMQDEIHDSAQDKIFASKISFIERVEMFVQKYSFLVNPIDWNSVEFAEHMS